MFCKAVEVVNSNIYSWLCISRYFSYFFLFSIHLHFNSSTRRASKKERTLYDGQLVSTLRTQMFYSSDKACSSRFSASSVSIMCCLSSEREHFSVLFVVDPEEGNTEPDSKTPCSHRSNWYVITQVHFHVLTASTLKFNPEVVCLKIHPVFGKTCVWITKTNQRKPQSMLMVRFIHNLRTSHWQCRASWH
jgi:hypothetical protein